MSIVEFLLARIADDEAVVAEMEKRYPGLARDYGSLLDPEYDDMHIEIGLSRVLAECKAKRAIVEWYQNGDVREPLLWALAAVYADHPDYDPEWRLA